MSASLVWKEPFRIRAYEIGPDGCASALTLLDYCQEAAGSHASALGVEVFSLASGPGLWVLARFRMAVERLPAWREGVTVETWPSTEDGLRAERDFLLLGDDAEPLAHAASTWLVIDAARRRPTRLPATVRALPLPEHPRAMPAAPSSPSEPPAVEATWRFDVRRADLDRVGHANNARFVEWALEAVPDGFFAGHRLAGFDVVFRGEALHGDVVVSAVGPSGGGVLAHRLTREADGRVLAVLETRWDIR